MFNCCERYTGVADAQSVFWLTESDPVWSVAAGVDLCSPLSLFVFELGQTPQFIEAFSP